MKGAEAVDSYHKQAEKYLLKAMKEGDKIQRSYASLAYAYCVMPTLDSSNYTSFYSKSKRGEICTARLKHVVEEFGRPVPERALRALYALYEYYSSKGHFSPQQFKRFNIYGKREFRRIHL